LRRQSDKLRRAGIGQVRRHVKKARGFIIEGRRKTRLRCMLNSTTLPDIFKAPANSQRRGSEYGAIEFRPQALPQDGGYVNRRGLNKNIASAPSGAAGWLAVGTADAVAFATDSTASPALDPEDSVAIVGFHREAELHLKFLSPAHEIEHFFGFLRQILQFAREPGQRLVES